MAIPSAETIRRLSTEHVDIVDYDPRWPALFLAEKEHL
jgi:GrpB-like predicted nucleotidyltransferase (UPF0157 family)